jgi:hypothetical protein
LLLLAADVRARPAEAALVADVRARPAEAALAAEVRGAGCWRGVRAWRWRPTCERDLLARRLRRG